MVQLRLTSDLQSGRRRGVSSKESTRGTCFDSSGGSLNSNAGILEGCEYGGGGVNGRYADNKPRLVSSLNPAIHSQARRRSLPMPSNLIQLEVGEDDRVAMHSLQSEQELRPSDYSSEHLILVPDQHSRVRTRNNSKSSKGREI